MAEKQAILCSHCLVRLRVKSELIGKSIKCPKCKQAFVAGAEHAATKPEAVSGVESSGTKRPENPKKALATEETATQRATESQEKPSSTESTPPKKSAWSPKSPTATPKPRTKSKKRSIAGGSLSSSAASRTPRQNRPAMSSPPSPASRAIHVVGGPRSS